MISDVDLLNTFYKSFRDTACMTGSRTSLLSTLLPAYLSFLKKSFYVSFGMQSALLAFFYFAFLVEQHNNSNCSCQSLSFLVF